MNAPLASLMIASIFGGVLERILHPLREHPVPETEYEAAQPLPDGWNYRTPAQWANEHSGKGGAVNLPEGWRFERASGWWQIHHLVHECGFRTGSCFDTCRYEDRQQILQVIDNHNCEDW